MTSGGFGELPGSQGRWGIFSMISETRWPARLPGDTGDRIESCLDKRASWSSRLF